MYLSTFQTLTTLAFALATILLTSANDCRALAQDDVRCRFEVINGSQETLTAYWVKPDGSLRRTLSIAPDSRSSLTTFVGHEHILKNEEQEEVAKIRASLPIQAFYYQRSDQLLLAELASQLPQNTVIAPPPKVNLHPLYEKLLLADGYPVVGSAEVDDYALLEAGFLINKLLANRPKVRSAMVASGSRLYIMSEGEFTTDLPEFKWLAKRSPVAGVAGREYWDARARGLGGSETDPFCSVGEENLLAYPGDPYASENILIHEFAHNIHLRGLTNVDPNFDRRLREAYQSAMGNGSWQGKYASVNHHEYFAEGVQSWFDDNREDDHDHNHVNTRQELIDYDPGLAAICSEVFGKTELTYTKPTTRLIDHMAGYQPSDAPIFRWPKRLQEAKAAIRGEVTERVQKANK